MTWNRILLASLGIILMPQIAVLSQGTRPITLDDLGLEVSLSDLQISPNGQKIAVVASTANYEDNRFENQLWLIHVQDGTLRPLTYDRARVRRPRWSPTGDRLAFIAQREGKGQVFILRLDGGEGKPATSAAEGVGQFSWSPDGATIAYTSRDSAPKREDQSGHNKSFKVGRDVFLASAASRPSQLWLQHLDGSDARQLTKGFGGLQTSFGDPSFDWSPDGRQIAYLSQPAPHTGEVLSTSLRLLDLDSGLDRSLLEGPLAAVSCEFSPDGQWIGLNRPNGPQPFFYPVSFFAVPVSGGDPTNLAPGIDRNLFGQWMGDGRTLILSGTDGTQGAVWKQVIGGASERFELEGYHPRELSISANGTIAFIGSESKSPSEVYILAESGAAPRQLTDFNAELTSRRYGRVETIEWDGPDGFRQDGVLIYPPNFQPGLRYPLVLAIHGGPMSASTEAYRAAYHVLAAQGWIVFSPNYRGSNNRGAEFQAAVINDAGEGPGRDVMSGIEAVKRLGVVDEARIAVSGWSYGGYMTTWLIAHYQGWAAAVAGAAVTDWFDWYNLADINNWAGYGLGGSPWLNDNLENYWRQSPIKYAPNIRTPTLILSNTLDPRVTVTQSYKLYYALRDNGVEVEFIGYPLPGHFPQDPVHQKDVWRRWIEWIQEHF